MKYTLILLLLITFTVKAQKIVPYYGPFPEPAPTKNLLFYLQRTVDRNTIIYELNYDINGELNSKKPIKMYWVDFENGAKITPLTFMQSKFAYGIESELIDEVNRIHEVCLVSYKKIKFHLKQDPKTKRYHLHANIKGKPVILKRIFVNITGGTYLQPIVSFIELSGHEPQSEKLLTEKIMVK